MYGMIVCMTESDGIKRLRLMARRRKRLDADIDAATESLLRDGEFIEDVALALDVSRETVRRFRDEHGIPDAREIRRAKGLPSRRAASS
jgi:hypothetical protein